MMLSVCGLLRAERQGLTKDEEFTRKQLRPDRGNIQAAARRDPGKSRKTSVRVVGAKFYIRTEDLPNRRLQRYRYANRFTAMFYFLAYFPYFEKIKGGLWDHLAVCVSPLIVVMRMIKSHFCLRVCPFFGLLCSPCPIKESRRFFFFGATAPVWALAYLHETLRFTSVF
jgi:hypothetical protein